MSQKIKKMLAASAMCISTAMLVPQQIPAAVRMESEWLEELPAAQDLEQQSESNQDVILPDDSEELNSSVRTKGQQILPAPDTVNTVKITYNSVTLNWSEVAHAVGYQIEYTSNGTDYTVAGKTTAQTQSYKCKKLLTGTEYQFRVCALDENGKAGNYVLLKAKPYLKKTKFTAISSPQLQSVALEWKKIAGATNYQLFRKSPEQDSYKLIATTTEPLYTDRSVTAGGTYSYRVCAICDVNGTLIKAKLSAASDISLSLPAIQFESCEAADYHSATLTWTQAQSATGYYIYRSVKEDGTYRKIKTITKNTSLSYTDTKIVPGKNFYYKICAYIQGADKQITTGEQSLPVQIQTQMDAPKLLTVKTNVSNRSLALEWEAQSNAFGYRIYRSVHPDKGFKKITDIASGSYTGYEDRNVTPGETYYYRIKSIYTNGSYKGLSQSSSILEGNAASSAPIGLTIVQPGTDILKISWESSNGAVSYNLYRADTGDGKYTCIAEELTDTSYEDFGLKDDQTYFYRVSAVNVSGEGTQCLPVSYTVGGVSMNTRTLKLCTGISKPLEISTFRQGKTVWKSDNPEIAEVNNDGIVTGISYGTTTVTATVAGQSASAIISVTPGSQNGIDVSRWQEDVDWCRVKKSGIDFAFLRICNHYLEDYTFETKYANASAVGMPLGVYCYSRATTAEEARAEAQTVLSILNGRTLAYPIALDLEDAVHKSQSMTKETLHEMIHAFKDEVEKAGYQFVLYSYVTFLNSNLDRTKLDGIDLWVARYRNVSLGTGYTGTGNQKYWQYNSGQYNGSNSQVDGITSDSGVLSPVDVNIEF